MVDSVTNQNYNLFNCFINYLVLFTLNQNLCIHRRFLINILIHKSLHLFQF